MDCGAFALPEYWESRAENAERMAAECEKLEKGLARTLLYAII
jgi:hypothetical protein